MAKKKKRYQTQFKFWLNAMNRHDQKLIETIGDMKIGRTFTDVIRQGLQLIPSLMRGETGVLFEMFPDIRKTLYLQMEADVLEKLNVQQSEDVIHHLIELKGVISQIKNQPMIGSQMQGTVTMKRVTTVTDEEIALDIKKVEGHGATVAQNFINSIGALNPVSNAPKQLAVPKIEAPVFDDDDDAMPMIIQLTKNEL